MADREKLARRLQKLYWGVAKLGLGGYHLARAGRERTVDTRRGPVRVLEYGFEDVETKPLFVDLHGGGFVLGSADMDEAMCLAFGSTGAKVISIDYPKAPDHPYPAAVEAVRDVIAWYQARGAELGLDTARMAIIGHSAGGNLATVTCINDLKVGKFNFRCQILDYPALDVSTEPGEKPQPKGALPVWMCRMFNDCYAPGELAEELGASPALAAPEDVAGLPPALIILCGRDSLHDEGARYAAALEAAGAAVTVREYPGQAHGFTYNRSASESRRAVGEMAAFLKEYCMDR